MMDSGGFAIAELRFAIGTRDRQSEIANRKSTRSASLRA
jgi:hypothetical protein